MPKDSALLKKIHRFAKEHVSFLRSKEGVLKPVQSNFLPKNTSLRSLYNQAYYCLHIGMPDAALSCIFLILERISRDTYHAVIEKPEKRIDWQDILFRLETYFFTARRYRCLKSIHWIMHVKKTSFRNEHIHTNDGKILSKYDIPSWKVEIGSPRVTPFELNANSEILPADMKLELRHRIIYIASAKVLMDFPHYMRPLIEYTYRDLRKQKAT